jgi:hypothetical protein
MEIVEGPRNFVIASHEEQVPLPSDNKFVQCRAHSWGVEWKFSEDHPDQWNKIGWSDILLAGFLLRHNLDHHWASAARKSTTWGFCRVELDMGIGERILRASGTFLYQSEVEQILPHAHDWLTGRAHGTS